MLPSAHRTRRRIDRPEGMRTATRGAVTRAISKLEQDIERDSMAYAEVALHLDF